MFKYLRHCDLNPSALTGTFPYLGVDKMIGGTLCFTNSMLTNSLLCRALPEKNIIFVS